MVISLYLLALLALLVGSASAHLSMTKAVPRSWLYYNFFLAKPLVLVILACAIAWILWDALQTGEFRLGTLGPLLIMGLAVTASIRLRQENAFDAVDFLAMSDDPLALPLADDAEMAVIDYNGVTRAYPLDYVIHHHIINDRFGDKLVSLTYCAMCRSIIPFDVTDIGPLFVASFKDANMIVADRKTKTFFQQASFESIIGKLHPHTLTMIPFQILPWCAVKKLSTLPAVAQVTPDDLGQFELPIPGVWKKIMAGDITPGLPTGDHDKTFAARTRVVGTMYHDDLPENVYLKSELVAQGLVHDPVRNVFLVATGDTVNGFQGSVQGAPVTLTIGPDGSLSDITTGFVWDRSGKHISDAPNADLVPVALSDEYWFSWKHYHPTSKLVRI